jgi:hypothetical protein
MQSSYKIAIFLTALFLLALAIFKAAHTSLVFDEAVTYFDYASTTDSQIIQYTNPSANNHMLNSYLVKFFLQIFPLGTFSLRIPNLIAYGLYLLASWWLVKDFKPGILAFSCFIILNAVTFLTDFFSLCRGYGMSAGLLLCSLFTLRQFLLTHAGWKNLLSFFLTLLLGALAVLANFAVLYFYLPLLGVCLAWIIIYPVWISKGASKRWLLLPVQLIMLGASVWLLLSYVIPTLFMLKKAEGLYYGGEHGFIQDTLTTLINCFLYDQPYTDFWFPVLKMLVFITLPLAIIIASFAMVRNFRKSQLWAFRLAVPLLTLAAAIGTILSHYYFGNPFLIQRTALFFIPLFLLIIVQLLACISKWQPRLSFLSAVLAALVIFHFIRGYEPDYFLIWKDEGRTIAKVVNSPEFTAGKNYHILYTAWYFEPVMRFYKLVGKMPAIKEVRFDGEKHRYKDGYVYITKWDTIPAQQAGKKIYRLYPNSNSVLLR